MSKAILIILLILVVLFLFLYPFLGALVKDKRELAESTLEELFPFFFKTISDGLFDGKGKLHTFDDDPKIVNMMSTDPNHQNMIVHFMYSTGNMVMEVGFKYYREELRFVHTAYGLRGGSVFRQKDLANAFVEEARIKIYEHKIKVTNLLHPDEIVHHFSKDKPFDEMDRADMLEQSFSDMTEEQKQALICVEYLASTVNGESEDMFTAIPAIREQLRHFNVSWFSCRELLDKYGEVGICELLKGLDKSTIEVAEPFMTASCLSYETGEKDPVKLKKLDECLVLAGFPQGMFSEIAKKNALIFDYIQNRLK